MISTHRCVYLETWLLRARYLSSLQQTGHKALRVSQRAFEKLGFHNRLENRKRLSEVATRFPRPSLELVSDGWRHLVPAAFAVDVLSFTPRRGGRLHVLA